MLQPWGFCAQIAGSRSDTGSERTSYEVRCGEMFCEFDEPRKRWRPVRFRACIPLRSQQSAGPARRIKESALIFLCPCYAVENGACKSAKITDLVDLQVGCGFLECDGHDWEVSVGTLWPVLLQDAQGSQQVLGAPADQCERLAGHWQTWEVLAGVSIELQGGLMVIWL